MLNKVIVCCFSFFVLCGPVACGGDDDKNGEELDGAVDVDGDVVVDAGEEHDAGEDPDGGEPDDQWIGSSCSCSGEECEQMGVPVPNSGEIHGCDEVPADWTGGDRACLRTYEGAVANNTYFANGYCSLMAVACEGHEFICENAVMGDYDAMTECPPGTVMLMDALLVEVMSQTATINNKNCVAACESNDDCRVGETDPVLDNQPTQYECIDKDGVKFCFDPRNLSEEYSVTAF